MGKQGSGARTRSSSDERRNSAKSPPGSPSLHYQVSYAGEVLTVTILECKVGQQDDQGRAVKASLHRPYLVCVHSFVYALIIDDEIS